MMNRSGHLEVKVHALHGLRGNRGERVICPACLMMADRELKLTGSGYDFNSLTSRSQQVAPTGHYLESSESNAT